MIADQPINVWVLIEDSLRKKHGRTLTYNQLIEVYAVVQNMMKTIAELQIVTGNVSLDEFVNGEEE